MEGDVVGAVGLLEGDIEGRRVPPIGDLLGLVEGGMLGLADGEAEGETLGLMEGDVVGAEGLLEGEVVVGGADVFALVGLDVREVGDNVIGLPVFCAIGFFVGVTVGVVNVTEV
jgi:hypothetical protein